MTVIIHGTEALAKFVAELVRQGITFESYPKQNDVGVESYLVTLTGGF